MNEFGEPNMGNPSVRFDEGRESGGHWPLAFQSILSRLLYNRGISRKSKEYSGLRNQPTQRYQVGIHGVWQSLSNDAIGVHRYRAQRAPN